MSETVTILGRVATDPTYSTTTSGIPVTNFRLASTHRRFDATSQTWVDAGTNWYSIAAFRQLGEHVKASLRTGDSVIVTGRLKIRNWEANGKHGTSVDVDAEAVGHDLRWGTSAFLSANRAASADRQRSSTVEPASDSELKESVGDGDVVTGSDESDREEEATLALAWAATDHPGDVESSVSPVPF